MNEAAMGLLEGGHRVLWVGPRVRHPVEGIEYIVVDPLQRNWLGWVFARRARRLLVDRAADLDVLVAFREYDVELLTPVAVEHNIPLIWFSRADNLANAFLNIESSLGVRDWVKTWMEAGSCLRLRRRGLFQSNVVVVQTPALKDQMRFFAPTISKRILVLPNNSNPSWVARDTPVWRGIKSEGKTVIGYVGRVRVGRGLEDLIDSVVGLDADSDVELRIFGPDTYGAAEIRARPEFKGVKDRVRFMGETDRALEEMAKLDVLVTNRYVDHCPNTVLEAMAVGTPIIATDIPAHRFLLGGAGLLYEPARVEELTSLLGKVANGEIDLLSLSAKVSERSQKFIFPWRQIAAEIIIGAAEGRADTLCLPEIEGWPEGLV